MRYEELQPCAALRGRVRYWRLTGGADAGAADAFEPVLPDGHVELVVHLGDPFWVERPDTAGRAIERQPRALLAGPSTRPVRLRPGGRADVIGVRFSPGAARGVCDVPLAELADELPALDAVAGALGALTGGLADELAEPRRGERWTDVLDRRLARALAGSPEPRSVALSVERLRASGGRARIDALADSVGLSPRQLERLFHEHVGIAPKPFARLVRFRRALALVRAASRPPLADVAARCGYVDQAHLLRDFRRFAATTPGAFRAAAPGLADHFIGL